ncbi:uncharacterized protein LOC130612878 [Hydractinia symbiolongicarpus]|uniref:uncharacterized protein LOC130612878 n=1 Tax=Hydractinia symbiolongicarpus TaxID=13093 RepID=UPI00254B3ACF|nr:uncharacterized protein LOC130612878 [Hydractinia symbiolongicarpus]
MWQLSYFWPLLTPNGIYFYEFVKDYLLLDPYFYNYTANHINVGIWEKLDAIQNTAPKSKAANLPQLLQAAYAKETIIKYKRACQKWVDWSSKYTEVNHCSADPFFVCINFNDLVMEGCSISTIISALCGTRWGHINAGFSSPTDHSIVKLAFAGAKRLVGKTCNKKEPFTVDIIKEIIAYYGESSNFMHMRFIVLCVLGFAGFFRIGELLALKVKDLENKQDSFEISVKKSKTDQLREGHIVYIAHTGNSTCPVTWLRKYLCMTNLKFQPDSYLICRLAKTKTGYNVLGHLSISYESARKTFHEHLNTIQKVPENFGLHYLRSGGASAAANNGVTDRMISKHGRWSSSSSRDGYIKDSKSQRLSVSKDLGL